MRATLIKTRIRRIKRRLRAGWLAIPAALLALTCTSPAAVAFPDCNSNGLDDDCDLECGIKGQHCGMPGCGGSADCNKNGIPDECDLGFPIFEQVTSASQTSSPNLSLPRPAATVEGTLLIALVIKIGGSISIVKPVDWLTITEDNFAGLGPSGMRIGVFYKLADANEPSSYNFSWGISAHAVGAILLYSGIDPADPIGPFAQNEGSTAVPLAPSIVTTRGNSRILRLYGAGPGNLTSFPLGHNGRINLDTSVTVADVSCAAADELQAFPGASGTASFQASVTDWAALSIAIHPAPNVQDCNGNGVPDECEPDCNTNGVADGCDIDPLDPDDNGQTSADCNGNEVPDECDAIGNDCDSNGVPDECDLGGLSYVADFEDGIGPEWSATDLDNTVASNYTQFTGRFGVETQDLTVTLYPGTSYTLVFDLAIIDSWDGTPGADWFNVYVNGVQMFHHTFHHLIDGVQTYPAQSDIGYANRGWSQWNDTLYRDVAVQFITTGAETTITFEGENLSALSDESWGVDNVRIFTGNGPGIPFSPDCNANAIPDQCDASDSRLYVDADATGGNTGLTWNDAFNDLQDGLLFAECSGVVNEIWVAEGIYPPDGPGGNRDATFQMVNGVALYGGFAGGETQFGQRDVVAHPTILSGDLNGDDDAVGNAENSFNVVSGSGVFHSNAGLLGRYFENINWTSLSHGQIDSTVNFIWGSGAPAGIVDPDTFSVRWTGLVEPPESGDWTFYARTDDGVRLWVNDQIVIDELHDQNGSLEHGGTIDLAAGNKYRIRMDYYENAGGARAELRWQGPNTAKQIIPSSRFSNQGLLDGFIITGGNANGMGGASLRRNGGGFVVGGAGAPAVSGCTFEGNSAQDSGGAVYGEAGTDLLFLGCRFLGNRALNSGADGGAMDIQIATIINSTFSGNIALDRGGAINSNGPLTVINSSFTANSAESGGAIRVTGGGHAITNCILWGNNDPGGVGQSAQVEGVASGQVNYCLVQGLTFGLGGVGNTGANPLFADADGPDDNSGTLDDNLRLLAGSPAIDAGNSGVLPADLLDVDGDGDLAEPLPIDLDGYFRVVDDPATGDTGIANAAGLVVDMGAYEFADCNANQVHDSIDVAVGTSTDCNNTGIPDECELSAPFAATSGVGELGPIGAGLPITYFAGTVNPSAGDVTITIAAIGDLADANEYIDVDLNGMPIGAVFTAAGIDDCVQESDQLVVTSATFNQALAVAENVALINLTASPDVSAALCGSLGSVQVSIAFDELINDCNLNGVLDTCDVDPSDPDGNGQTSLDSDRDGIPDECANDCNTNGVSDDVDIALGTSPDCNNNNIPDECDLADGLSTDCNTNGIPDECDVAEAPSRWIGGTECVDAEGQSIPGFECWNTAANWCPDTVPNNAAGQNFDVVIGGPAAVTLNISPTIAALQIDASGSLEVGDNSGANSRTLATDAGITNSGTLRATDRERFVLDSPTIDQSGGGVLESTDGFFNAPSGPDAQGDKSILEINGSIVIGGSARTTGTNSEIHLIGGAELQDVSVEGVVIPDGQSGAFAGMIVNDGVLSVAPDGGGAITIFSPAEAGATLTAFDGVDDCVRLGSQAGARLGDPKRSFVNGPGHRIDGAGVILGSFTNDGVIQANSTLGEHLVVFPGGAKLNNAMMSAAGGGVLRVDGMVNQSATGSIVADSGGTVLVNGPVTGGGSFEVECSAGPGGCTPATMEFNDASNAGGSNLLVTDTGVATVAGSAVVELTGGIIVSDCGMLRGEPGSSGFLSAGNLNLSPDGSGGSLILVDSMSLQLSGDLVVNANGGTSLLGGCTPPTSTTVVDVGGTVIVVIAGALSLFEEIDLFIGPAIIFSLAGDFNNQCISSATFDWSTGPLTLNGAVQTIEAAGEDRGPDVAGMIDNFAIGTLSLSAGVLASVADTFDNQQDGSADCDEALYVDTLVLEPGSVLNTNSGCTVYYQNLVNNGGSIPTLGAGVLNIATGDWDSNSIIDLNDYAAFDDCVNGQTQGVPQQCLDRFDSDHNSVLNLIDYAAWQNLMAGA